VALIAPLVAVPNSVGRWLCQKYNKHVIILHEIVVEMHFLWDMVGEMWQNSANITIFLSKKK
jgi:hypothetical protein